MQERVDFLTNSGMVLEDIAKAAVLHPQVSSHQHACVHFFFPTSAGLHD